VGEGERKILGVDSRCHLHHLADCIKVKKGRRTVTQVE
jgi:hypothetical protein